MMLIRLLFKLGWVLQVTLVAALLGLSLWIHQQAVAGYTALPGLAFVAALLLVAGKVLTIAYYPYATQSSGAAGANGLIRLLQLALLTLSLACALSFFAAALQRGGPVTGWLLEQVRPVGKKSPHGAIIFWCALFLSLLLELALFVVLQQLALAFWPLAQIEQEHRLQRYQVRRQTESTLFRARCDDQALRAEIQAERRRLERDLSRIARSPIDG